MYSHFSRRDELGTGALINGLFQTPAENKYAVQTLGKASAAMLWWQRWPTPSMRRCRNTPLPPSHRRGNEHGIAYGITKRSSASLPTGGRTSELKMSEAQRHVTAMWSSPLNFYETGEKIRGSIVRNKSMTQIQFRRESSGMRKMGTSQWANLASEKTVHQSSLPYSNKQWDRRNDQRTQPIGSRYRDATTHRNES